MGVKEQCSATTWYVCRMQRALGKEDEARNGVGNDQIIEGLECRLKD